MADSSISTRHASAPLSRLGYSFDSTELPFNTGKEYPTGNMGHRPHTKGGYFPVPPVDSANDIRAEMVNYINEMGVRCEKHHHEVAPSQHELGIAFGTLIELVEDSA